MGRDFSEKKDPKTQCRFNQKASVIVLIFNNFFNKTLVNISLYLGFDMKVML